MTRRLGTRDAVVVGLGSMLGAGVFSAFAPAAAAAGSGLLLALVVAAVVAGCNATSSARLAALYPESGGTYVYGRRRLGDFWGHLAGWAFVVGKTASCAAMALTLGAYTAPGHERAAGAAAVVLLAALTYRGVQKSAAFTRAVVALVLAVLAFVVVSSLAGGTGGGDRLVVSAGTGVAGVLQGAGFLFFAFAGYARIATLGEEVRDPVRTVPRAIAVALGTVLLAYAAVGVTLLLVLGADGTAATASPLRAAVEAGPAAAFAPVVQVGAAAAAAGSLLALLLGVSRTTLAMARDRHLPRTLAAVHPRTGVPHHAELAVAAVVVVLVATLDLRGAIGSSSFGVLAYYAVANACALTLTRAERRPPRWVPVLGLVGCVAVAVSLPASSVLGGGLVLLAGALTWAVRRRVSPSAPR
nr:APC family permease [Kineococcus siccus]